MLGNEFCTLFDVNYLPRGLVLYHSLMNVCDRFTLRVFCMDAESKRILDALELPHLTAIGLDELESHDPGLYAVKPSRTQLEYCWTATPAVCLYALEREPALEGITYVDADLMFFTTPGALFDEADDASILLVPHNYAARFEHWTATSGTYNVEFMSFRRTTEGLDALRWWRERCLEWCYYRFEEGKLGDQFYLNDWPERFEGVHVLQHRGGGVAPWNVGGYRLSKRDGRLTVDEWPLVFYHFHSLRLHDPSALARAAARASSAYRRGPDAFPFVWTTSFPIAHDEMRLIWSPYIRRLADAYNEIQEYGLDCDPGVGSIALREVVAQTLRTALPAPARSLLSKTGRTLNRTRIGQLAPRA